MKTIELVIECVNQIGEVTSNEEAKLAGESSVLFGPGGIFDSMDVVMLTLDLEKNIYESTGKSISLASEKAMSRTVSPFRNVRLMASFIDELIEGVVNDG